MGQLSWDGTGMPEQTIQPATGARISKLKRNLFQPLSRYTYEIYGRALRSLSFLAYARRARSQLETRNDIYLAWRLISELCRNVNDILWLPGYVSSTLWYFWYLPDIISKVIVVILVRYSLPCWICANSSAIDACITSISGSGQTPKPITATAKEPNTSASRALMSFSRDTLTWTTSPKMTRLIIHKV